MPKKTKKTAKARRRAPAPNDEIVKEVEAIGTEIKNQVMALKKRYDRLDEETKKKVMTGVASAAALLIGMHKIKKMMRRKK